ncbi:MAG: hypothetical protein PHV16_05255 [Candidatus Nanoarchaeia archaeon]|nr:hypothetical protein [Candidatus Nanoarchaeia archaeon]
MVYENRKGFEVEYIALLNKISPESQVENKKYRDLIQEIINKEKQKIN